LVIKGLDRFSFSKISVVVSFIECPCKGATFRAVAPEMSVCDLRDIDVKYHNQKLIETKTLVMGLSGMYRTQESSDYCRTWVFSAIVTRFHHDCSVIPKIIPWHEFIAILTGNSRAMGQQFADRNEIISQRAQFRNKKGQ